MVIDLKDGDCGVDTFLCAEKQVGNTKNGKLYYSLRLQDSTGVINAKVWEVSSVPEFSAGDFLQVAYQINLFAGNIQLKVLNLQLAEVEDISKYVRSSKFETKNMMDVLLNIADSVQNDWLRKLLNSFMQDSKFFFFFVKGPGAVKVHHAFSGGLLQHTLFVTRVASSLAKIYKDYVNYDLLVTSAILHDIGKVEEINGVLAYEFTEKGTMYGHTVLGAMKISEKCNEIDGFPKKLKDNLVHCVLAHHGELEWGAPVKPALIEALILHFADNLDSRIAIFDEDISIGPGTFSRYLGTRLLTTDGV